MSEGEENRKRRSVMTAERRKTMEAAAATVRHNKEILSALRRENKELKTALQQAQRGTFVSGTDHYQREEELLKNKQYVLRRSINDVKAKNDKLAEDIGNIVEETEGIYKDGVVNVDQNTPIAVKIRSLENRLDKCLIKHNEVMSIRRTYETIVERLESERVGFDNQLLAIEKTLKSKEHDYQELHSLCNDALNAKEQAKVSVQEFKLNYAEDRRQKKKDLEERMNFVRQKKEHLEKQDKQLRQKRAHNEQVAREKQEEASRKRWEAEAANVDTRTEEEIERLRQYNEAYKRIKEATQEEHVRDVILKFISQEDTSRTLTQMNNDTQSRIDMLLKERAQLLRTLEESKYSSSGTLNSRRILDEFESHLIQANASVDRTRQEFEVVTNQLVNVRAGIDHLSEMLSLYRPEMAPPMPLPGTEHSNQVMLELLRHCETKLQILVEEDRQERLTLLANQGKDEVTAAGPVLGNANAKMEVPPNNLRIPLTAEAADEERDSPTVIHRMFPRGPDGGGGMGVRDDDPDDDPHDRVALKHMSLSAVDREQKKARKRRAKGEE